MKMKKLVLFISMLVCVFSMTACSSGKEWVKFDYTDMDILNNSIYLTCNIATIDEASKIVINNTEGQEIFQKAISNFDTTVEECGEFVGFKTKDNQIITLEQIAEANSASDGTYDNYLLDIKSDVSEDGEKVKAVITAVYGDRDVEISFVYVGAPAQTTVDQNTGSIITPFQISEITVSPVYSMSEKMKKAGMNTLMGMGTVFAILIFIALIIGQFERLSKAIEAVAGFVTDVIVKIKGKDEDVTSTNVASAPVAVPAAPVVESNDLMNDSQLVAVITAAIMAAEAGNGNSGSDGLVVRSIRKAKR